MTLTIFKGHSSVKQDQLKILWCYRMKLKLLCNFYLHRQDYVYIPIFLLLVLHVFKRNYWYVSLFKKKTKSSFFILIFQFCIYKVVQSYSYYLWLWAPCLRSTSFDKLCLVSRSHFFQKHKFQNVVVLKIMYKKYPKKSCFV